jgi:ribosomal protein S27E
LSVKYFIKGGFNMTDKSQEKVGGKSGQSESEMQQEKFFCPACESEHVFPGHKGETVMCSTCGASMKRKPGVENFFVCPECSSELEAPGHKGEPVRCPSCGKEMEERHASKESGKSS